jgi:predicted nuclease of predicted toxin-antitoxin system
VKFLFDQNVSRRLVAMFLIEYPESQHVTEVGLDTATDADEALLILP